MIAQSSCASEGTVEVLIEPQLPVPLVAVIGNSPAAGSLRRLLEQTAYRDVRIDPFDFLHPKTPVALINGMDAFGRFLENVPVISEIAGSLYIRAIK